MDSMGEYNATELFLATNANDAEVAALQKAVFPTPQEAGLEKNCPNFTINDGYCEGLCGFYNTSYCSPSFVSTLQS